MEKDHSNKKDLVKKPSFFKKGKKERKEKLSHQINETSSVTETLNDDEINEKFEKFLDDINIPADKRDILLTKSTVIKAQMMSNSLTAQKRPTSDYIELLNQILHGKLSESKICENLDVVRICLNTCPVSGIKEFNSEKNDGLNLLLSVLNIVIDFPEASVICLRCFREFANCGYGLFKLMENQKAYFFIARCLNSQNMLLMYFAVELLTILTFYSQNSYQNVMDGLFQFSKFNSYDSRFSPLIEGLKHINIENEHESLSFACSRFINVIVNPKFVELSSQPLDEYYRLHLRKEFVNLGVLEIYNELLCNDKLKLTHEEINKFLQEYETEEEDITLRSEGILLAFNDTTEIFRILNRCLSNTKCEKYFRSILSSLTIVREDPIRDYLFQFIDEVVAEIILQDENGFCPDPVLRKFDKITVRKFVDEGQVEELKKALDAERLKKEEYLMMLDIYRAKDKQEGKQTIISSTDTIEVIETLNINTTEDKTLSANAEDDLPSPVVSPVSVNELITKYDSSSSSMQIKGIKISTSPKQSVSDTGTNILAQSSPISEKELQSIDSSHIRLSKSENSIIPDSPTKALAEDQTLLTHESLSPINGTGVVSSGTSEILETELDVPKKTSLGCIDSVSVSNISGESLSLSKTQNISKDISTVSSDIQNLPLVDSGAVDLPKIGNIHEDSISISAMSENNTIPTIQIAETKFDLSKDSFQPVTDITVSPDTSGSSPPVSTETVQVTLRKPLISQEQQKIIEIEVPVPPGPPPPTFDGTVPVPPCPPPPIFGGTIPVPPCPPPSIFDGAVPVPPCPPPPIFGGTIPVPPCPPPQTFGGTVPIPPCPPQPTFGGTVPVPPCPPPSIFGGAVPVPPCPPPPSFGGVVPLPPGPPPGNFSFAPPPPPPGGISVAFSKPPNILQKFGLKRTVFEPQQPMKKANWNKINEKNLNENSIWLSIKEESISASILKELEDSFSSKPLVEKVNSAKGLASSSKKVKELKVLDGKTAQNISILLGSLRMDYDKLKQAILEINTTILSQSMIEQLLKNLPEPEQMQKISELTNAYDELSESEQFCFQLSDIKQLKPRLESILFKLKFDDKINEVKSQYYEAEMALKEIKESPGLKKIIEIVLSLGNFMNSGSRNQQSIGFEVSFLCKLSSTKDKTNNRSLIHFLAEIVMKSFFNPLDLKKELSHIENASRFSLDITNSILIEIKKDVKAIENQLKSFTPSSNVDKYFENMAPFVDTVKEQIVISERFQTKMNDAFTSVSEYFSFNRVTYKMEDLFNDMTKFISEFANAHKMNEEKKLLEERALKTKLEKERREQQKLNKAVSPTTCEEDSGVLDNLLAALKSGDGALTPKRRKPKFKEGRQALDNRSRSRGEFTESLNTNVITTLLPHK